MIRRCLISVVVVLACSSILWAVETSFDDGWIRCHWSDDGQALLIDVSVEAGSTQPGMWVLTVVARRFSDGVFAWQIHLSPNTSNILVIPNDFLTSRVFSLDQLGIESLLGDQGHRLRLAIPADGPIPQLVAPGDDVEVHALWVGHEPLATMRIPSRDPSGWGGGIDDDMPAGDGEMALSFLPEINTVVRGQLVSHQFRLPDDVLDAADGARISFSYTLLRVHADGPNEFVRYAQMAFDEAARTYAYEIDTDPLAPGAYQLIIGSSIVHPGLRAARLSMTLTIVEAEP